MRILFLYCCFQFLWRVLAHGSIELRLVRYDNADGTIATTNQCCDVPATNGACVAPDTCDPIFDVCVQDIAQFAGCQLGRLSTGFVDNVDHISFGNNIGSDNVSNPVTFPFTAYPSGIILKITIYDEDKRAGQPKNTKMDYLQHVYRQRPKVNDARQDAGIFNLTGTVSSLQVEFSVRCDDNFYGPDCSTECVPGSINYRCSIDGELVCNKGYSGVNCDIPAHTSPLPTSPSNTPSTNPTTHGKTTHILTSVLTTLNHPNTPAMTTGTSTVVPITSSTADALSATSATVQITSSTAAIPSTTVHITSSTADAPPVTTTNIPGTSPTTDAPPVTTTKIPGTSPTTDAPSEASATVPITSSTTDPSSGTLTTPSLCAGSTMTDTPGALSTHTTHIHCNITSSDVEIIVSDKDQATNIERELRTLLRRHSHTSSPGWEIDITGLQNTTCGAGMYAVNVNRSGEVNMTLLSSFLQTYCNYSTLTDTKTKPTRGRSEGGFPVRIIAGATGALLAMAGILMLTGCLYKRHLGKRRVADQTNHTQSGEDARTSVNAL